MEYPNYNPQIADQPLTDEELQGLDELLQAVPNDAAMNVEGLDGYLTGLLVGPVALDTWRTAEWLPAAWGGDGEGGAPFSSGKQRKRATVLVLRHLQSIHCQLRDHPEHWQPVFSVAEVDEQEVVDAEDWCIGFLQAVALAPDAWEPLFDDPQLGAVLVPVVLLGGDESQLSPADRERLADPAQRDELSRAVMDAVLLLNERRQTP
jgi:uncharacterized protein